MPHGLQCQGPGDSGAVWEPRGDGAASDLGRGGRVGVNEGREGEQRGGCSALCTLMWRTAKSFPGSCFKGQIAGHWFFFSIHRVVHSGWPGSGGSPPSAS